MAATMDMTMKLVIDTKGRKVLYAEATKAVIDFLFSILSLPLGSVTKFITKNEMPGSIGNLYYSIENFRDAYMLLSKDVLLNPVIANPRPANAHHLLPTNHLRPIKNSIYKCTNAGSFAGRGSCQNNVTFNHNQRCPTCGCIMTFQATMVGEVNEVPPSFERGFVQGLVSFMIMDDLVVKPLSSAALIEKLIVNEMGSLEERVVNVTIDEGKKLLKASLQSKTPLTDVFFEEKMPLKEVEKLDDIEKERMYNKQADAQEKEERKNQHPKRSPTGGTRRDQQRARARRTKKHPSKAAKLNHRHATLSAYRGS